MSRNSQERNLAAGWSQQTSHEIHDGRLPCSVGSDQTGNSGCDLQIHPVHTEDLSIELGDVIEDDQLISSSRSHLNAPPRRPSPSERAKQDKSRKFRTARPRNTTMAVHRELSPGSPDRQNRQPECELTHSQKSQTIPP